MSHIFISYSKKDIKFARHLRHILQDAGFAVWMDESQLKPGERWVERIEKNVRDCAAVIAIVSPEANESEWVERELLFANEMRKPIFPVLFSGEVPLLLANRQYEDMSQGLNATLTPDFVSELAQYAPRGTKGDGPQPPRRSPKWVIAVMLVLVAAISIVLVAVNSARQPQAISTSPTTAIAVADTPTLEPTIDVVALVATLDAQATAAARLTQIAAATQVAIDATATATSWTRTPTPTSTLTPDITASIDAFIAARDTATASVWTSTPTPTPAPIGFPGSPVASNEQWQPHVDQYRHDFEGIEMVLVPVGCFNMGGDPSAYRGNEDGGRQCFDIPYWIGRYEVTNIQYGTFGEFSGPLHPRESVNWFEARDYCASKNMRLPTEAEWEYAARGPNDLLFPWGNTFVLEKAINRTIANNQTANVGSRPSGTSWVGSLDMSGNVWEWTSSIDHDYPYMVDYEHEFDSNDNEIIRVLRGGSWYNSDHDLLRAAARLGFNPSNRFSWAGFRCARDFDPADLN